MNAFVGFCLSTGGNWPSPFLSIGYKVGGIEKEISTSVNGHDRTATADVVCSSAELRHVLLVDAKSRTVSDSQAKAYESISPREVFQQGAAVGIHTDRDLTCDPVFATFAGYVSALQADLGRSGSVIPIIGADASQFQLATGSIGCLVVDELLRDGIDVAGKTWPTHFIKFKSDSEFYEMAPSVASAVVRLLMSIGAFEITEVLETAVPHWKWCGSNERRALRSRVAQLIAQAQAEEFDDYLKRPGPPQYWTSHTKKPLNHPKQIEALQTRAASFVHRLEYGIEYKPGQPPLIPSSQFPEDDEI